MNTNFLIFQSVENPLRIPSVVLWVFRVNNITDQCLRSSLGGPIELRQGERVRHPRRQRGQQFLRERLHGGRQEGRWPGDLADDPRDPQRTLWGLPCWQ